MNDAGMDWRINRVEKSSFFLNSDIESLINNVESTVINELEGGNRQAGMKRLKVFFRFFRTLDLFPFSPYFPFVLLLICLGG